MEQLAIGIDLGGTNLKGVIINESGESRHLTRIRTNAEKGGDHVLESILTMIDSLIQKEGSKENIIGVGIGTPGFVDQDGTVIGGAENLPGWKGTQLYAPIKDKFGLKAVAANDVTVTAYAEWKYGAGQGVSNMVCFALGTGIGGGIVIDNKLYKGTHGMAGELGHIVVETNGFPCKCGQSGCVEQYASGKGIVNVARKVAKEMASDNTPFVEYVNSNPEDLGAKSLYKNFVEIDNPDPVGWKMHETVCDMLARAIGFALNTLAPDKVVLGGGVMKSGKIMLEGISKFVPRYCWPAILERCEIVTAALGEDAGVLGSGAMVFGEKNCA